MPFIYTPYNGKYAEIEIVNPKVGDRVIVVGDISFRPRETKVGDKVITVTISGQTYGIPINKILDEIPVGSTVIQFN